MNFFFFFFLLWFFSRGCSFRETFFNDPILHSSIIATRHSFFGGPMRKKSSLVTRHSSLATRHSQLVTHFLVLPWEKNYHSSLATRHSQLVTRNSFYGSAMKNKLSLVTRHLSLAIRHSFICYWWLPVFVLGWKETFSLKTFWFGHSTGETNLSGHIRWETKFAGSRKKRHFRSKSDGVSKGN